MQAVLQTLVTELQRLKAQGVDSLAISAEALAALRDLATGDAEAAPANPAGTTSSEPPATRVKAPGLPTKATRGTGETIAAGARSAPVPAVAAPALAPAAPEPSAPAKPRLQPMPFTLPAGDKATRWQWLKQHVTEDPICLANVRPGKKVVLGVGSLDARIMFVGEAPGAEEEIQGEPFVGPAGQLLTKMIIACGLRREDVYIGNIMNWRPQIPTADGGSQRGNREPNEEEMNYCLPFLRAQIEIVDPAIVVGLGATAAKGLLGYRAVRTLGEVRGRWHDYLGRPLMITYHPSYLLHREAEGKESARKAKRAAWEDFLLVMEKVGLPISEKQRGYFRTQ